jgi:hypothetical protein
MPYSLEWLQRDHRHIEARDTTATRMGWPNFDDTAPRREQTQRFQLGHSIPIPQLEGVHLLKRLSAAVILCKQYCGSNSPKRVWHRVPKPASCLRGLVALTDLTYLPSPLVVDFHSIQNIPQCAWQFERPPDWIYQDPWRLDLEVFEHPRLPVKNLSPTKH